MAEPDKPVVVDAHPEKWQHQDHSYKEDADLRGSKGRLKAIASEYQVDARLQDVEQEDLAHRSANRQRQVMQKQQANLEAIIAHTYESCHSETAQTPDPDWLVRFFRLSTQYSRPCDATALGQDPKTRDVASRKYLDQSAHPFRDHDPARGSSVATRVCPLEYLWPRQHQKSW